jgi:hypothetical protein
MKPEQVLILFICLALMGALICIIGHYLTKGK